jgi:hypothetical protein
MIFGYAILRDWRLLSALAYPLRNFASVRDKRKIIQQRRRISDRHLLWWFNDTPRAAYVDTDDLRISARVSSSASEDCS